MKHIKRIFIFVLIILILLVSFIIFKGYRMYEDVTSNISIEDKISQIQKNESYVQLENVSDDFKTAIISIEDHRFYDHSGFDIISFGRAIISNLSDGVKRQGGSTISQQLARNMYFTQEKKYSRKVAELFVVYNLEKNYSKDDILELYINTIYFGDGHYGIYDASTGYFNKEPSELNLYESSLLAGLPNAPTAYALSNHSDLAEQRRQFVIDAMIKYGGLSKEQADLAKK